MRFSFKSPFFLSEAILYACALAAGIFIAYVYGLKSPELALVRPIEFSWGNAVVFATVFLVFSLVLARYRQLAGLTFRLVLLLVIFSGAQLFFATFLPSPWDLFAAVLVIAAYGILRIVAVHNVAILLGIAGVSAILGLSITPQTAMFVLAGLSIYDIIAVYRTRHMVRLAEHMISSGAVFGFIIPARMKDFFVQKRHAQPGEQFMILGSGDVGVPLLLICSTVTVSLSSAFVVAAFSLLGLALTHLLFVNQTQRRPMAALPPIATLAILGYLISLI